MEIPEALVKEYLTANGYEETLATFKRELGARNKPSSRRELALRLGLRKAVERNKEKGSPLKSYLEVLCVNVTSKIEMNRARGNEIAINSKYIKTQTDKSEIHQKPVAIPNAFSAAISTRQHFTQPNGERRTSQAEYIEIIEDLELSDDDDSHFQQKNATSSISLLRYDQIEFTIQTDQDITKILFPAGFTDFSSEWKGKGFVFQTIPEIGYGLIQLKGGPCGLLAATQAVIIKILLRTALKGEFIRPNMEQSKNALVQALAEIIWNAGVGIGRLVLKSSKKIISVRLTSDLFYLEFNNKEDLLGGIRDHLSQFYHGENKGNGLILFLLSVIASRGVDKVKGDMDEWSESLIGKHSYCTQEMVNLILYGKAISNLHDGTMDLGGQILKGLEAECEIGQLSLFEHYDNLKIGNYGKTPRYPIFVVCSESHYTVLFGTMKAPPSSNASSFDVFYYDGLSNQTHEIKLSLTPHGRKGQETRDLIPPIELCLCTKWGKDLLVDWNGTEPLL